jgi:hypothetical protein
MTTGTEPVASESAKRAADLNYDLSILRHMLGVASNVPKKDIGYRNYFNSCAGHSDLPALERLEANGLVRRGGPNYWHATEAGCKAIGLTDKQIKKAFAP